MKSRTQMSRMGSELWRSDGTRAGTELVLDINPGSASSNPAELIVVGNRLYFTAIMACWQRTVEARESCRELLTLVSDPACP